MSVNMLGVENGEQEMHEDRKEVDILVKSPESGKIKKSSPSIKSFFLPKESEKIDNKHASTKDTKKFFIPQDKSFAVEKIAEVELIQESDSDENGTTKTEKSAKGIPTGSYKDALEWQAVESAATMKKAEESGNSSSKKPKPKWSLSWRVKKSKMGKDNDSDSEDFVELSNNEEESKNAKKLKSRQSKTEKNEDNSRNNEKAKGMELKDDEKKEKKGRRKKRMKNKEVADVSMENIKNDEVKEKNTIEGEDDQGLSKTSKEIIVEKEEVIDLSDISERKIESKSHTIPLDNQTKQVKSAFDVLMNPAAKSHIVDDNEKSKEPVTIEDISAPTTPDKKSKDQIVDCSPKQPLLESPESGNAFDILMTKKKPNENNSNSKKSPQKSKLNSAKFQLNIRYSKPLEIEDGNVGVEDDGDNSVANKMEQHASGGITSKKNKKAVSNEKTTATKKLKDDTDNANIKVKKKTKSHTHPEIHEKLSSKNTKPDVVNITYISVENLELVEEPRKMTKVKKKKSAKTKGSKSESIATIEVQEDSNSSAQEVPPSDIAGSTPKTGSHCSSSEIMSPGSDDFEVMPTRTGLRKRTPKNYTSVNEQGSILVEDKKKNKKKEEKEKKCPEKDPGSPDVEVVMTCKRMKQDKEHKNSEPKNLASIFLKKPKTIEKKETTTDQTTTKKATHPKDDDGISILLDDVELKAANTAFTALFATSRTTKATVPAVQLCQQPAPWPSVSHVTQRDDDQSDEVFCDSKIEALSWKLESVQDIPRLKNKAIQLGEFTSTSEKQNKRIQKVSPSDSLSTAAVKKVLSEVSSCFPGIPIKRLYKQYRSKEGKKELENVTEPSKEQKEDLTKVKDGKECLSNVEERLQKHRGRSKRKISIESDDDLSEKQQKKVPRTKEKEEKRISEKAQKVENKKDSSKRLRKKREREEEEEVQNKKNTKRKSSRLKKCSEDDKNQEESKSEAKVVESSKRKKRKTIDDDDDNPKQVVKKHEKSEDSRSSLDEKRIPDKRELLWTEKYQPECSSEVMGNASSVSRLRSWLEEWKIKREKTLRKEIEMQKRLLAKQKNKDSSEKKQAWWEDDQDSDFHLSDEDSDDSGNEESGMCNAMLVLGPKGAGKTAAVYACAKELGYKVFEVNCSSKRSNKQILSRLEEATQSHLVITNPSANTPKASAFGGLFGNLSEKAANPSPVSNFFKTSNENQQEKNSKNQRSKKGSKEQSEKEKERKLKGKEKEEKEKNSGQVIGGTSDSDSMPALSLKAASLIFFEEVDVIFEDDKGFWSAVTSFMRNAKCPIIMTSNDSRVDCDGRYEQLMIRSPSVNLLSAHLLVTALVNDVLINPSELKALASWFQCDIRKCLLALQFWILSGGGVRISWEEFLRIQKDQKQLSDLQSSSEIKKDVEKKSSTVEQPLELNDPGEESLFLTLDDWKTLGNRPGRASRRGHQSPASASDFQNEDSDFEPTKPSIQTPTDENTHTDSILDANEPGDSQSMQIPDNETLKVTMPEVHCVLMEHVLGLTNSTYGYEHHCIELLKDGGISSEKDYPFHMRCSLTYNTQKMGINLVSNNLPTLLPSLHTSCSSNPRPVPKATKETPDIGNVNSMFSDKSLFDDGTSETPKKKSQKENDVEKKTSSGTVSKLTNEDSVVKLSNMDVVAMTMDKNGDAGITTEHKDSKTRKDAVKEFQGEALEMFGGLAEDMSFMDAYIPGIATDTCSEHTAAYGWWHAHAGAGLSDNAITVTKRHEWLTCDTNACIRGALEVASLENSYAQYKSLVEKKQKYDGKEDLEAYLPCKEESSIVNLTGLNKLQSSKLSSRNKLYKSVSSSLPLVTHCTHHVVSMDYLPTIRSICHTERLREQGNTKRRFLHYLDSNSLCINKTSQQSLADAFLAPH